MSPSRPTVALAVCSFLATGAVPIHAQPSAEDPRPAVLALLHDGRFVEAETLLAPTPARSADPAFAFFRAFVSYWQLVYDDEDQSVRERFDHQLDEAIALADTRLHVDRSDAEAALWGGASHLLLAQLRALQKKPLGAAFEAKRAKKLLESASRSKQDDPEPLFGLGLYNYVADQLPAFVKGLRALLFLPGGNRELGLRQLARAANESRYFALEARILLLTFYSSRNERLFDQALQELRLMLRNAPEAIAVKDAAARTLLSLGDVEGAIPYIEAGLSRADAIGGVHPDVRGTLLAQRAMADYVIFRPDLARPRAAAILENGESYPREVREDARNILLGADAILAGETWAAVREVIQGGDPAADVAPHRLLALSRAHPADPFLALIAGHALLRAGEAVPAAELLARADASGGLSPSWIGWCRLLAGEAFDLAGNRGRALEFYRSAVEAPNFLAKDGAHYRQTNPYTGEAL